MSENAKRKYFRKTHQNKITLDFSNPYHVKIFTHSCSTTVACSLISDTLKFPTRKYPSTNENLTDIIVKGNKNEKTLDLLVLDRHGFTPDIGKLLGS